MPEWLGTNESRIGLGCMRFSTERERDDGRAIATVHAALDAGVTVFDSARAYALDDSERGHNERLLARALAAHPAGARARVVSKCGMTRPGGAWRPDGRARSIVADCEESLEALGGRSIDLYLLHAPDPRSPFATSVRALASLVERGLVPRIGVCNVNRRQLAEALELAPISALEVALGAGDDEALRGGVVSLAAERGLWVLAHAPFGGPKRAAELGRDPTIAQVAERFGATPAQVVLSWLMALHPLVVALPGARRPESAREAAGATRLVLDGETRALLGERLGSLDPPRIAVGRTDAEVVLVAGLSGAGKSTQLARFTGAGYLRLNRDEHGGTLASIAAALDEQLSAGARRLVLDNTYLTRASRYDVLRVAARHRVPVRCVWLDTPLVEAQRNAIERMLEAHGALLAPDEMARGADDPTRLAPRVQFAQARQLELPDEGEGFRTIERVRFVRQTLQDRARAGRAVALEALLVAGSSLLDQGEPGPRLVFAWLPAGDAPLAAATRGLDVETAACTHPGGRPICWCRPPLPGLLLAFSRRQRVDLARLTVVGTTTAHRRLAAAAGARFERVSGG
jgi:aryl-alcohol dehydrogenase-like predicted oxidoreductase/predicted kinase